MRNENILDSLKRIKFLNKIKGIKLKKREVKVVKKDNVKKTEKDSVKDFSKNLGNIKFLKTIRNIFAVWVIWNMIKKDLKLILRSRSSSLIIVLGPLFLILLVGAAFNTSSLYGIKVGTYSDGYSALSESIIQELNEKQFSPIKMESKDRCIKGVKVGEIHVCAVFPANLQVGSSDNILFYVDNSRINLVYTIMDSLSTGISTKSTELSLQLTKTVLDTLDDTNKEVEGKRGVVGSLSADNQEASNKIVVVSADLSNIDLEFKESDVNLQDIQSEAETVRSQANLSGSVFEHLMNLLDTARNSSVKLEDKFMKASNSRDTAVDELNKIKAKLSGNSENINLIGKSMEKITNSIANIEITSAEKIVSPLSMKIESTIANTAHLTYLFPTLVVLVAMFISLLLSSILVVREKISPAYFRNFMTPVKAWLFALGAYLTNLMIVWLQLIVISIVALFFFKELSSTFLNAILVLFFIISIFILLGMLIGYLFRSEETSSLAAISMGSVLLFFSNTILPIESLPVLIKRIADYNPFVLSESILKKVVLFQAPLNSISKEIIIFIAYMILLIILIFFAQRLNKK